MKQKITRTTHHTTTRHGPYALAPEEAVPCHSCRTHACSASCSACARSSRCAAGGGGGANPSSWHSCGDCWDRDELPGPFVRDA